MTKQNDVYTDYEGFGFYKPEEYDAQTTGESLYNWVFHYNEFTGVWNAIPRDAYNDYWSNRDCPAIISSKSIDTLKELIAKTGGDKKKIERLVGEQ